MPSGCCPNLYTYPLRKPRIAWRVVFFLRGTIAQHQPPPLVIPEILRKFQTTMDRIVQTDEQIAGSVWKITQSGRKGVQWKLAVPKRFLLRPIGSEITFLYYFYHPFSTHHHLVY